MFHSSTPMRVGHPLRRLHVAVLVLVICAGEFCCWYSYDATLAFLVSRVCAAVCRDIRAAVRSGFHQTFVQETLDTVAVAALSFAIRFFIWSSHDI